MKFKDTEYGDLTGKIYRGSIDVSSLELTSLEGAPKEVDGGFDCSCNTLTSLEFSPEVVKGEFLCNLNQLTTLRHAPKIIYSSFDCSDNSIKLTRIINEIIENGIFANVYFTDIGRMRNDEAEKVKDEIRMNLKLDSVKSKGFRTLLGLKNV